MGVVGATCALPILLWIKPEKDSYHFGPFRTLFRRIEQANVQRQMPSIVFGQIIALRRFLGER
jgi:hypothetical protein